MKLIQDLKIIYKLRGILMAPPFLFVMLCTWGEIEEEIMVFGLGGTIFSLGLLLRIWSQLHLHYRLKIPKILTTTGPYAYVRNPIYIGNTLIVIGVCVISELLWFAPIMLAYCAIVYIYVVRYEESHLYKQYGTPYLEYIRQVPRWIPNFKACKEVPTIDVWNFFWASLLAEVHCLLWIIPFIAKELIF